MVALGPEGKPRSCPMKWGNRSSAGRVRESLSLEHGDVLHHTCMRCSPSRTRLRAERDGCRAPRDSRSRGCFLLTCTGTAQLIEAKKAMSKPSSSLERARPSHGGLLRVPGCTVYLGEDWDPAFRCKEQLCAAFGDVLAYVSSHLPGMAEAS